MVRYICIFSFLSVTRMEILRLLALVVALWASAAIADSNLDVPFPFNCSTRATCADLRLKLPTELEEYNALYSGNATSNLVFQLTNSLGDDLVLTIEGVRNQAFRVIIEEKDEHRYKLDYSLEKEPTKKPIKVLDNTEERLIAEDDENNKIIVYSTPLSIEFYHNNILETVFEGNRVIVENTEQSQAFTFSVRFVGAERLIGLHEHAANLILKHTVDLSIDPYRLKNNDFGIAKYAVNSTNAGYGSIPVLYGFGNTTSGIFHNNAAEQWVDIDTVKKSAYFMVDGGRLDLFVLLGPSLRDTIRQYMDLTGKPHLPQLWALGYHQCRWAYNTTEDVMATIGNFDTYDIPLDVLWLDIEYTDGRKWFRWNFNSFPDPVELLNWVDSQGHRKLVPISDPHMKVDPEYTIYTDLSSRGLFVNNSDNSGPFVAEVWPGNASWVDFLNPAARDYYANLHLYENFPSTPALGGFWNDMNEPASFDNLYERSVGLDAIHYGQVKHRDVHNIYGLLHTMSTHQGLIQRDNGTLRPFILSRAYFSGSQRYALKWSGDNWGEFINLRYSVPMALTSNLVGLVFYGADIPGFFGIAPDELVIRWYQIGIWLPFFRAHATPETPRREPYLFDNVTRDNLREHIQLRYKHLPYWYTLFYEHTRYGDPLIRPLLYQYPNDPIGYDLDDEFLIGSDILTTSVYESDATFVPVYFPGQNDYWVQITGDTAKYYQGGTFADIPVDINFIPVFYRSGGIISRKPRVLRSSADIKDDPFELHIVLDNDGFATSNLYIDDFESFKYMNEKQYLYVNLAYSDTTSSLTAELIDEDSNPGTLQINVESVLIYRTNAGAVSVTKHEVDKAGQNLKSINILKNKVLL